MKTFCCQISYHSCFTSYCNRATCFCTGVGVNERRHDKWSWVSHRAWPWWHCSWHRPYRYLLHFTCSAYICIDSLQYTALCKCVWMIDGFRLYGEFCVQAVKGIGWSGEGQTHPHRYGFYIKNTGPIDLFIYLFVCLSVCRFDCGSRPTCLCLKCKTFVLGTGKIFEKSSAFER